MRWNPLSINPRLMLYLSAAGASCAIYRRGNIDVVRNLSADEEGWDQFNNLLLEFPRIPIAIAVDTVDELYRQDILPSVHGADRREMTTRRLRQLIHHSPYRAALRQGPLHDGTQRDRYLMMGLTNPEIIRPWLDIAHVRGRHLSGIWLLPALSIPLARQFRLHRSRVLLVSEQTGGLRLTYLEGGELRFSRLAPVDSSQYEDPLESYADEIERTRQALVGQRLLTRGEPLRTVLIDPLNTLSGLHVFLPASAGFLCESIQRPHLIDTLELPPSLLAESADALYLSLLASAPASANLMTPEQREETRIRWWNRGLRFVASTWMIVSLFACSALWLDALRLQQQARQLREATQAHLSRQAAVLAQAGGVDTVRRRLDATNAWRQVDALDETPVPAFALMRNAAAQAGRTLPRRMVWENSPVNGNANLVLEGEIAQFDGDYVAAHASVDKLQTLIRHGLPGPSQVQVDVWPLDISPSRGLEGEFGHSHMSAAFRIEAVTRR